jgi:endoglucanase
VSNKGGTDTASLQLSGRGSIAGCISIPTRYVHTSVEACHPDDIDAAVALTAALIEQAHRLLDPA